MSRKCSVSGKGRLVGHRVSHANNKTKHVFKANIQPKTIFLPTLKKSVRVKLSTRIIRTIDKIGLEAALKKYGLNEQMLTSGN
jgi:large subunit ribosomal protein L28